MKICMKTITMLICLVSSVTFAGQYKEEVALRGLSLEKLREASRLEELNQRKEYVCAYRGIKNMRQEIAEESAALELVIGASHSSSEVLNLWEDRNFLLNQEILLNKCAQAYVALGSGDYGNKVSCNYKSIKVFCAGEEVLITDFRKRKN